MRGKPGFLPGRLWRASVSGAWIDPQGKVQRSRSHAEAQERIGSLGRPAGRKKETPREEKAQEGRGLGAGLNRQPEERTLAGSKALKQGVFVGALFRYGRSGIDGLAFESGARKGTP